MKAHRFIVTVDRTISETVEIVVSAASADEAHERALEIVQDDEGLLEWETHFSPPGVTDVSVFVKVR